MSLVALIGFHANLLGSGWLSRRARHIQHPACIAFYCFYTCSWWIAACIQSHIITLFTHSGHSVCWRDWGKCVTRWHDPSDVWELAEVVGIKPCQLEVVGIKLFLLEVVAHLDSTQISFLVVWNFWTTASLNPQLELTSTHANDSQQGLSLSDLVAMTSLLTFAELTFGCLTNI